MIKQITEIIKKGFVEEQFPLKNCSSFGIGGDARFFVSPASIDELFNLVEFAEKNNLKYKIIGNATNILFGDNGFNGLIISTKKISSCALVSDTSIFASAGTMLSSLINFALSNSLGGLEFAVGIPGTVGGALVMNAGAGGSEISKITKSVTVIENGDIRVLDSKDLQFGYRTSYFKTHKSAIILFAEFEFNESTKKEIEEKIQKNLNRRLQTQPKNKSAGCVFKKCGDTPAGLLIDQAGLKGTRVGDALISEVHANFIVNTGNAKAEDVKKLINLTKEVVYKKFNKELELEIEIIE